MFYFYEVWSKIISYKKIQAIFTFRAIYWYDVLNDLLSTFEILGKALNWKYVLYFQKVTEVTSGPLKPSQSPLLSSCHTEYLSLGLVNTLWCHFQVFISTLTRKTLNENSVLFLFALLTHHCELTQHSLLSQPFPGSPYRLRIWKLRCKPAHTLLCTI